MGCEAAVSTRPHRGRLGLCLSSREPWCCLEGSQQGQGRVPALNMALSTASESFQPVQGQQNPKPGFRARCCNGSSQAGAQPRSALALPPPSAVSSPGLGLAWVFQGGNSLWGTAGAQLHLSTAWFLCQAPSSRPVLL